MIAERPDDIPLFNLGGDVEDIRARCEAETHLPAPVKPTFITGAG
jgi:N-methylhydantoinase B